MFIPFIYHRGSSVKTEIYETRNCYPVQSKETIEAIEKQLNILIQCKFQIFHIICCWIILCKCNFFLATNLSKAPNKVCVVYDERMLKHHDISDDSHPEKPNRISVIYKKFQKYNLLERCYVQQVY